MIKNYIKIAWRNLKSNKIYSFINIAGLTIGLLSCLLVATVVVNELSYDKQWDKSEQIYRILSQNNGDITINSPLPIGPEAKNDLPETEAYCRLTTVKADFKIDNTQGFNIEFLRTEETIWDLLDLKILNGTPQNRTEGYPNLVITKKIKDEYFPTINPVGKIIKQVSNYSQAQDVIITGIIEEIPQNSIFRSEGLLISPSRKTDNILNAEGASTWGQQFLLLSPGTSLAAFSEKFNTWFDERMKNTGWNLDFKLQPLEDTYLNSNGLTRQRIRGSKINVIILSAVAILLLFIGCTNFINLTTARISKRIKETTVRKILGASKKALFTQYLIDSLLYFTLSFFLAIFFYQILFSSLDSFVETPLIISLWKSSEFLIGILTVLLCVGILTALYPAILMIKPRPNAILSKAFTSKKKADFYRKALVITQFTITVGVLVSAVAVNKQLTFLSTKNLGYNEENLLQLGFTYWGENGEAFKQALKDIPGVENASISGWQPAVYGGSGSMTVEDPLNEGQKMKIWLIDGDKDLGKTLELKLKKGKWLDDPSVLAAAKKEKDTSKEGNVQQRLLITEYTAKRLGVDELNRPMKGITGIPVGIVENFNNESLRNPITPTIINGDKSPNSGSILLRVADALPSDILKRIHDKYKEFFPNAIFEHLWIKETLAKEFKAEQKLKDMLFLFSILTVVLSCLGLFGLITFMAENRIKEISIRKVLGASVLQITTLLSKGSLLLVFTSILIAVPITWYAIDKWLMDFPYRISIDGWLFVKCGAIALAIALITLCIRTVKASMQNPADNLRNE
ncbi:ABC transporter permease [Zunongwangia sp.]|uniref:ABC transporter permease n=1 Tax=Zunongwangia sp. TaxID=1965325 RepID=UPI003AA80D63